MIAIFDGHNDAVQNLQEYRPDGNDFLARSSDGHLDLPSRNLHQTELPSVCRQ